MACPVAISGWLRWEVLRCLLPPAPRTILEISACRCARRCYPLSTPPAPRTILEISAGKGGLGALLARDPDSTGLEPDLVSHAAAARLLGERVLRLHGEELPPATSDAVLALDVLKHVEDAAGALRRWRDRVRRGAYVFLGVSPGRRRFGVLGLKAGHFRRYDR